MSIIISNFAVIQTVLSDDASRDKSLKEKAGRTVVLSKSEVLQIYI